MDGHHNRSHGAEPQRAARTRCRPRRRSVSHGSFRYEDLVAAADVVVTKPGFGIIAECIAARTPMLYTSRGDFREYDLLVREMPKNLRCRFITHADLFGGRWRDALTAARTARGDRHGRRAGRRQEADGGCVRRS